MKPRNDGKHFFPKRAYALRPAPKAASKGSRKNNFAELALRFGSGLADPREQNHRNSWLFRGFCD
jgi:hypothetical protein